MHRLAVLVHDVSRHLPAAMGHHEALVAGGVEPGVRDARAGGFRDLHVDGPRRDGQRHQAGGVRPCALLAIGRGQAGGDAGQRRLVALAQDEQAQ
ncbi:MAG TPA: hypothetical protein VFY71_01880 [Planctomycetota bacterium]|nr:hypothetical protein [Planctomycetota bacterium]